MKAILGSGEKGRGAVMLSEQVQASVEPRDWELRVCINKGMHPYLPVACRAQPEIKFEAAVSGKSTA